MDQFQTSLTLKPTPIATGSYDDEAVLVYADSLLLAVLLRLSTETHDSLGGLWFLEAGFGPCATQRPPIFESLETAQAWILKRISQ